MPEWIGAFRQRIPIAQFLIDTQGLVAGMASQDENGRWFLRDSTAELEVTDWPLDLDETCWLALDINASGVNIVFRQPAGLQAEQRRLLASRANLLNRWRIQQAIVHFFDQRGFVGINTPTRVACAAIEPFLDPIPTGSSWLRTSPELHIKRLLATGFDRIYEMGPAYRDEPRSRSHREEFTMLEWYRLFADLEDLVSDVTELLLALSPHAQDPSWFEQEPEVMSVCDLFMTRLNLDLAISQTDDLARFCDESGIHCAPDDTWDDLFFRILLHKLEPQLGQERPLILTDYPASQAALAKQRPATGSALATCYRFELYIKGMELANAFYELVDAKEQATRIAESQRQRSQMGRQPHPTDRPFLMALKSGLPPCAGIALGVDRLAMVLLGVNHIDDVLPF